MSVKDFEMRVKNSDGSYDILHPATKAKNVFFANGENVENKLIIEEGIFTPYIAGINPAGSFRYNKQKGTYFRVGKLVYGKITIELNKIVAKPSGALSIRGLPYVPSIKADSVNITRIANVKFSADAIQINAIIGKAGIFFRQLRDSAIPTDFFGGALTATSEFNLSFMFIIE